MAFAHRLLSRSRKFRGVQVTTRHVHGTVQFFFKDAALPVPAVKGVEIPGGLSKQTIIGSSPISSGFLWKSKQNSLGQKHHTCRFSVTSDASDDLVMHDDLLHFVRSAVDKLEGPNHCWLNKNGNEVFGKDGPYVILVGVFLEDMMLNCRPEHIIMFERVKSLQQKYPLLQVFGFQSCGSVRSLSTQSMIIKTIMEHYITFPILLSEKNFKMSNEPSFLLLKDFTSSLIHREWDVDLEVIVKDLEEFDLSLGGDAAIVKESSKVIASHAEIIEEPCACSPFRNLVLYYPSCISADDCGSRLFLSDTNHHRIIVTDVDGVIIDCLRNLFSCSSPLKGGGSPLTELLTEYNSTLSQLLPSPTFIQSMRISRGFEDGEFDSAKLMRPAGSVYDDGEDCLYFVDSENHAVRRAHMGRRVLETLYPVHDKKSSGIWSWILDKLTVGRKSWTESNEVEEASLAHPWHLMKSGEDDLLVINRSFETLWVVSVASGEVKEVCRGFPNIMEIHGQIIMERASLLEELSPHVLWERTVSKLLPQTLPYAGFISSISNLQNSIIFCDPVRQRVFKYQRGSTDLVNMLFTNMGLLGMPYWITCPLENVVFSGNSRGGQRNYHFQSFNVLPGRCGMRVNVRIPEYTALAAPLHSDCIWRQARGAAAEVSSPEVAAASVDKVGVAQKWFDELDNLAFSPHSVDSSLQEEDKRPVVLDANTVHIDCAINLSPGTSEVVISAVLCLKLRNTGDSPTNLVRENMRRLLDLQEKLHDDACIELLESSGDATDLVFQKPLHLRIRLDCGDHPPARTSKEFIPTDSILDVNFTLE